MAGAVGPAFPPPGADPTATRVGVAAVLGAATLWGLLGLFATALDDRGMDATEMAMWRALIGGGAFVGHAVVSGRLRLPPPRGWPVVVGFGALGVGLFYTALPKAIDAGGVGVAVMLLYTAPAFVLIGARLVFDSPITVRKAVLVAVTLTGVGFISLGASGRVESVGLAVTWGLTSAVTYALWYLVGRFLPPGMSGVSLYALALPIGALVVLPTATWSDKTTATWALVAGMGLVSTYLPYLLFGIAIARLDATRAAVIATVEPVVAAVLGVVVLDERLAAATVFGGLLVVASAALATREGA